MNLIFVVEQSVDTSFLCAPQKEVHNTRNHLIFSVQF